VNLSFSTATDDDYRELGNRLNDVADEQHSQEDACQVVTEMLYKTFKPEIALARIYRLAPVDWLPGNLQDSLARRDDTALVLMGTYGVEDAWRSRHQSRNHQVVSLKRVAAEREVPMMVETLEQLGLDLGILYETGDLMQATVNPQGIGTPVYIPNVVGSEFVPDQKQFVEPYSVQSLIGFGGLFRDFDDGLSLYFVVVFTRVPIDENELAGFLQLQPWVGTSVAPRENVSMFND
jgi:hypothetical protein